MIRGAAHLRYSCITSYGVSRKRSIEEGVMIV
jgi:hypothetical protein